MEYKNSIRQLKKLRDHAMAVTNVYKERLNQANAKLATYEFVETEPLDYPLGEGTPEQEAQWKRQEQGDWS